MKPQMKTRAWIGHAERHDRNKEPHMDLCGRLELGQLDGESPESAILGDVHGDAVGVAVVGSYSVVNCSASSPPPTATSIVVHSIRTVA